MNLAPPPSSSALKIMGVDPGSRATGYALIQPNSEFGHNSYQIHSMGVWRPSAKLSYHQRLEFMHQQLSTMISTELPSHVVIESAYVGRHPQSVIKLSEVRGALLAATFNQSVILKQMSAPEVKKAITGRGSATKQTVALILIGLFSNSPVFKHRQSWDATDALALALAYARTKPIEDSINAQST